MISYCVELWGTPIYPIINEVLFVLFLFGKFFFCFVANQFNRLSLLFYSSSRFHNLWCFLLFLFVKLLGWYFIWFFSSFYFFLLLLLVFLLLIHASWYLSSLHFTFLPFSLLVDFVNVNWYIRLMLQHLIMALNKSMWNHYYSYSLSVFRRLVGAWIASRDSSLLFFFSSLLSFNSTHLFCAFAVKFCFVSLLLLSLFFFFFCFVLFNVYVVVEQCIIIWD